MANIQKTEGDAKRFWCLRFVMTVYAGSAGAGAALGEPARCHGLDRQSVGRLEYPTFHGEIALREEDGYAWP